MEIQSPTKPQDVMYKDVMYKYDDLRVLGAMFNAYLGYKTSFEDLGAHAWPRFGQHKFFEMLQGEGRVSLAAKAFRTEFRMAGEECSFPIFENGQLLFVNTPPMIIFDPVASAQFRGERSLLVELVDTHCKLARQLERDLGLNYFPGEQTIFFPWDHYYGA